MNEWLWRILDNADPVRRIIDNAELVPPPLGGYAPLPVPPARGPVARLPARLLGIAAAESGESLERDGAAEPLFLYVDANGVPRALTIEQHGDRQVLLSVVAGDGALLGRLWPPANRWNIEDAARDLFARQAEIGIVRPPPGFSRPLAADAPSAIDAHLKVARMAAQLLRRGASRAEAAAIAASWNTGTGSPLAATAAAAIVAAVARREASTKTAVHG